MWNASLLLCSTRHMARITFVPLENTHPYFRLRDHCAVELASAANDLPDRVDFVYTAGKSKILESLIMGEADTLPQVWFDHHMDARAPQVCFEFKVWQDVERSTGGDHSDHRRLRRVEDIISNRAALKWG